MSLMSWVVRRVMSLPPPMSSRVTVDRGVRVPMDDGVELLCDVYAPGLVGSAPTVLVRSPYGRSGFFGLLFGRVFAERGYRVVVQSCRGTFGSGGEFHPNFDERSDGLATIRWIERQAWFDGRLAMNGPSYLGGVQWAVADSVGPSLRALCTHVTYSNIATHWYRGGSFALGDMIEWTAMISSQDGGRIAALLRLVGGQRRVDREINTLPLQQLDERVVGRRVAFWRELLEHPSVADPFWAAADHSARVALVDAPVLQVGGWYDIFLPTQLADYAALVAAGKQPRLVIGPWTHTSQAGFATQLREALQWLDLHTRDEPSHGTDGPPVRIHVMGADEWRETESWPPDGYTPQPWYLLPEHRLGIAPPVEDGADPYTYDPNSPTPIVGGTLLRRSAGRRDQARIERRADVLVYTSDVLAHDVEVIGNVSAQIYLTSDVDHFDVYARLCDVDRRGRSVNVCDGITRVSPDTLQRPHRGAWAVPIAMWPTAYQFRVGHRIRVQISGGAHPRFARNLGTSEPIATATTTCVAGHEVQRTPLHPSAIFLPIQVPANR